MRYILSFAFILLIQQLFAQKPFQGTIVYSLKASTEKKDAELTAMFGVNKIKIKMKEKDEYDKKYIIIDLDSAKSYTVDSEAKDYKTTRLSTDFIDPAVPKVIAGYNTTPVQSTSSGPFGMIRQFMGGSTTFYTANDLFFPIDPKYSNSDLIIVQNNKIVLGATIVVKSPFLENESDNDSTSKMIVTAEAIKIDKTPLPIQEFLIPQDYVKHKSLDYSMMADSTYAGDTTVAFDTTIAVIDSESVKESEVIPGKKPVTKPKSKTKPTPSKKPVSKKGEATQNKKS